MNCFVLAVQRDYFGVGLIAGDFIFTSIRKSITHVTWLVLGQWNLCGFRFCSACGPKPNIYNNGGYFPDKYHQIQIWAFFWWWVSLHPTKIKTKRLCEYS